VVVLKEFVGIRIVLHALDFIPAVFAHGPQGSVQRGKYCYISSKYASRFPPSSKPFYVFPALFPSFPPLSVILVSFRHSHLLSVILVSLPSFSSSSVVYVYYRHLRLFPSTTSYFRHLIILPFYHQVPVRYQYLDLWLTISLLFSSDLWLTISLIVPYVSMTSSSYFTSYVLSPYIRYRSI